MAATKTQTSAPKTEEKEQTIEQRDQRAKVKGKQIMFERYCSRYGLDG